MPSFDVVSEVDRQELRNAIDQAQRELANRYDFKDTNSEIEQKDLVLTLRTSSEDRLRALKVLLEERFVKRNISLKSLDWGKVEQATGESVRQIVTIKVGVPADKAREINKLIKEKGPKGVAGQTQGDQLRVSGKKRDDLQETIAMLRAANLDLPLQFINFRD
ncbi:MAG: YajQ family cyclic di-GMP-binding protein [Actinobacteria bacterium]|jgi:cyclic-di-GMP-binding protein|nr:YajQ family cyclic di-GMP-binding protein [Actinomycetota bacterium]NCU80707.1 YajQ family cyclic di-GMP-binding protein [Acidimicrobiia bacterium]HBQ52031.1 YajQ family cyclic di-GMP-binding protein [Acidimicrobium sp.]NBP41926.1 YajQ family cyclic di-GMP-binding protein [Actinomycetota bacterium]NBQ04384.1 YajQ family cyclic di-GMP-binding protein [Actinomycetota bacterium]